MTCDHVIVWYEKGGVRAEAQCGREPGHGGKHRTPTAIAAKARNKMTYTESHRTKPRRSQRPCGEDCARWEGHGGKHQSAERMARTRAVRARYVATHPEYRARQNAGVYIPTGIPRGRKPGPQAPRVLGDETMAFVLSRLRSRTRGIMWRHRAGPTQSVLRARAERARLRRQQRSITDTISGKEKDYRLRLRSNAILMEPVPSIDVAASIEGAIQWAMTH